MAVKHRRGVRRAPLVMAASSMLLFWHVAMTAQQHRAPQESSGRQPIAVPESAAESSPEPGKASGSAAPAEAPQTRQQPSGGFKGWLEKGVRTFASEPGGRERRVTMSIGTVTPGSGIAGGAGYKSLDTFKPGLGFEAGAMLSYRLYQQYSVAFGQLTA